MLRVPFRINSMVSESGSVLTGMVEIVIMSAMGLPELWGAGGLGLVIDYTLPGIGEFLGHGTSGLTFIRRYSVPVGFADQLVTTFFEFLQDFYYGATFDFYVCDTSFLGVYSRHFI